MKLDEMLSTCVFSGTGDTVIIRGKLILEKEIRITKKFLGQPKVIRADDVINNERQLLRESIILELKHALYEEQKSKLTNK